MLISVVVIVGGRTAAVAEQAVAVVGRVVVVSIGIVVGSSSVGTDQKVGVIMIIGIIIRRIIAALAEGN